MGIFPKELIMVLMFLLVGAIIVFIFKQGIKILNIIIMVLVLIFCWYSFFTDQGSVKFAIAINGHPVIAYTTEVTEAPELAKDNIKYYTSSKDLVVNNKTVEYIKCETKWIIKLSSIE